jgi:hypothetical protein
VAKYSPRNFGGYFFYDNLRHGKIVRFLPVFLPFFNIVFPLFHAVFLDLHTLSFCFNIFPNFRFFHLTSCPAHTYAQNFARSPAQISTNFNYALNFAPCTLFLFLLIRVEYSTYEIQISHFFPRFASEVSGRLRRPRSRRLSAGLRSHRKFLAVSLCPCATCDNVFALRR